MNTQIIKWNSTRKPFETESYDMIACSDGAFSLFKNKFSLDKLEDFISGDFDSQCQKQ